MHNKLVSQQYAQAQVRTVDRGRLLMMMFDGAMGFLKHAKDGIEKNDKAQFSRFLSKAHAVITELNNTLDFEKGGAVVHELERLYDFMLFHLTQANVTKNAKKIGEVINVLQPIVDAYREILSQGKIDYDKLEAEFAKQKELPNELLNGQTNGNSVKSDSLYSHQTSKVSTESVSSQEIGSRIRISL